RNWPGKPAHCQPRADDSRPDVYANQIRCEAFCHWVKPPCALAATDIPRLLNTVAAPAPAKIGRLVVEVSCARLDAQSCVALTPPMPPRRRLGPTPHICRTPK